MTRIFVACPGSDDPVLSDDETRDGPILAQVKAGGFDRVLLLGEAEIVGFDSAEWMDAKTLRQVLETNPEAVTVDLSGFDSADREWIALIPNLCLRLASADSFRAHGLAAYRESKSFADENSDHLVREPATSYKVKPQRAGVLNSLGLIAEHPAMVSLIDGAEKIACHPVPVLLLGETGTGKELLAQFVHRMSGRPVKRFVAVNCGALPEALAESMLFGHRKGAFTGAAENRAGLFERADGGTLFLDELGEMPLALQAKLLRVLQDGVVEPIGASEGKRVDVRVIAATHGSIESMVSAKTFREDLYYRLSLGTLRIPPLRERAEDIPAIAQQVLARMHPEKSFAPSALARLSEAKWKGNVRDLENVIGRSAIWSEATDLEAGDLIFDIPGAESPADPDQLLGEHHSLDAYLASVRERVILQAVDSEGSQRAAAQKLGISQQAVSKFLKSLG